MKTKQFDLQEAVTGALCVDDHGRQYVHAHSADKGIHAFDCLTEGLQNIVGQYPNGGYYMRYRMSIVDEPLKTYAIHVRRLNDRHEMEQYDTTLRLQAYTPEHAQYLCRKQFPWAMVAGEVG